MSETWGTYFWEGLFFFGGGGLLSEFYGIIISPPPPLKISPPNLRHKYHFFDNKPIDC